METKQLFVICCSEKYTKPEMEAFRRKFKKGLDDLKMGKDGIVVFPNDVYVNVMEIDVASCCSTVSCQHTVAEG